MRSLLSNFQIAYGMVFFQACRALRKVHGLGRDANLRNVVDDRTLAQGSEGLPVCPGKRPLSPREGRAVRRRDFPGHSGRFRGRKWGESRSIIARTFLAENGLWKRVCQASKTTCLTFTPSIFVFMEWVLKLQLSLRIHLIPRIESISSTKLQTRQKRSQENYSWDMKFNQKFPSCFVDVLALVNDIETKMLTTYALCANEK